MLRHDFSFQSSLKGISWYQIITIVTIGKQNVSMYKTKKMYLLQRTYDTLNHQLYLPQNQKIILHDKICVTIDRKSV